MKNTRDTSRESNLSRIQREAKKNGTRTAIRPSYEEVKLSGFTLRHRENAKKVFSEWDGQEGKKPGGWSSRAICIVIHRWVFVKWAMGSHWKGLKQVSRIFRFTEWKDYFKCKQNSLQHLEMGDFMVDIQVKYSLFLKVLEASSNHIYRSGSQILCFPHAFLLNDYNHH